jgi:ribosomal RNA-processing protein 36
MAMSAKRPVTRKRQVVELERVVSSLYPLVDPRLANAQHPFPLIQERRDPRFSALSASSTTDPNLTILSYSFLTPLLKSEFSTARARLNAALKAERSSPRDQREERIAEREEAESEVARLRSRVEVAERQEREREALARVKKEEKDKRAHGKGEWHLKRGTSNRLNTSRSSPISWLTSSDLPHH